MSNGMRDPGKKLDEKERRMSEPENGEQYEKGMKDREKKKRY